MLLLLMLPYALSHADWPRINVDLNRTITSVVVMTQIEHRNMSLPTEVLHQGRHPSSVAWGSFTNAINSTGWSILDLKSDPDRSGEEQAYAVGFLEGALTADIMWMHLHNTWILNFDASTTQAPQAPREENLFIRKNLDWMRSEISKAKMREIQVQDGIEDLDEDVVYWLHVGYLLKQLEGLKPPCFESITLSLLKP